MTKNIVFTSFYFLIASIAMFSQGSSSQIGSNIFGLSPGDQFGSPISMSADGNMVAISARNSDANGVLSGQVRIFENIAGNWIQKGSNLDGRLSGDRYGVSLALNADGSVITIGTPNADNASGENAGMASVYVYDGNDWVQIGSDLLGSEPSDFFGHYLSINDSGTIIAVGSIGGSGRVRVYENNGGNWVQQGSTVEAQSSGGYFGVAVELNAAGDIMVIGASGDHSNGNASGQAYVYGYSGTEWTQIGNSLEAEFSGDQMGSSVSINAAGNVVASSARFNPGTTFDMGHVRIYENVGGQWLQLGEDIDGENSGDKIGNIALDETGLVIGIATGNNSDNGFSAGHARVFQFISGNWIQVLADIDGDLPEDVFGSGFDMNRTANVLAGGSILNDTNGNNTGKAQIFGFIREGVPSISCPNSVIQEIDFGACTAVVTFPDATATDPEDGALPVHLIAGLPSGSEFPIGNTTVTFEATDSNGNSNTCSFTITVFEEVPPVPAVDPLDDLTAECEVATLPTPTGTDNCSATVSITNNAVLPITTQGTTVITWTYDDGNGNTTTQNQNIILQDITPPSVTCPPDLIIMAPFGATFIELESYVNSNASDNCGGVVTSVQDPVAGTQVDVGTTITVTITNTDEANNMAQCTFEITVEPGLSIDDISEETFILYPNPTSDYVKISGLTDSVNYKIYSISGTVLGTGVVANNEKISVQSLSAGTYFLVLEDSQVIKIVKK